MLLDNWKGFLLTSVIKCKMKCRSELQFSTEYAVEVMNSLKSEKQASEVHSSFVEKSESHMF